MLGAVGTAFSGALAWIAKYILGGKDAQIARLEAENKIARDKIDVMQSDQLKLIQDSLLEARKRAETDDRVARSLAEQTALLGKLTGATT